MSQSSLKLTSLKAKIVTDTTLAGLETAVNTFLKAGGERRLVDVQPFQIPTDYAVLVTYTEG